MKPRPSSARIRGAVAPETTVRMKAVRQRDTAPEKAVRSLLRRLGVRYRVCPDDLPGRPDIANKRQRWCIFVHGCFWHGHESCTLARLPKTNHHWWSEKISANKARDARKVHAMRALGFTVAVVWQCEIEDEQRLAQLLSGLAARRGK